MKRRTYTPTELGMVYGMAIGSAIALVLFALTNDAWWFGAIGAGLAIGLGIGSSYAKRGS
jgi:hypothetical protein